MNSSLNNSNSLERNQYKHQLESTNLTSTILPRNSSGQSRTETIPLVRNSYGMFLTIGEQVSKPQQRRFLENPLLFSILKYHATHLAPVPAQAQARNPNPALAPAQAAVFFHLKMKNQLLENGKNSALKHGDAQPTERFTSRTRVTAKPFGSAPALLNLDAIILLTRSAPILLFVKMPNVLKMLESILFPHH